MTTLDRFAPTAATSPHQGPPDRSIRSLIPARLDRLGWSRFHTMVVVALGVAWVLDGLEITIASNATSLISSKQSLNLSSAGVSFAVGTIYLLGEVFGALFFGRLSDKWGRRNLFMITLGVYLFGGFLTSLTFGHSTFWVYWLYMSRFVAGMGIGGEYAAINSAIDELIPAKYRGRVDIAVNGTYWGGALLGTILTLLVVNHLPIGYSWRVAFLFGPALGVVILFVRKNLPESPRWLLMHGREDEAEAAVKAIESASKNSGGTLGEVDESKAIEIAPATDIGFVTLARTLFATYPKRSILGATLMITQSFLYNAIFFTYALVLTKIYNVPATDTAYYFIFFALGNLVGPLTIGHLFDTVGRRRMIAGTYIVSGVLLAIERGALQRRTPQRHHPDGVLVRDLLLRLRRSQRRLPHRERDLSGGGEGQGDRRLLCHRSDLRRHRPLALRIVDRQRPGPFQAVHRLPHRSWRDGHRRPRRDPLRRGSRGEVTRGRGPSTLVPIDAPAPVQHLRQFPAVVGTRRQALNGETSDVGLRNAAPIPSGEQRSPKAGGRPEANPQSWLRRAWRSQ